MIFILRKEFQAKKKKSTGPWFLHCNIQRQETDIYRVQSYRGCCSQALHIHQIIIYIWW